MKKTILFKTMLLLCALIVGSSSAWAEEKESSLIFTAACGGSGTADDGAVWTVTSDGTESSFDSQNGKGIHYGTGKAAVQYVQLSTSDISGTITKVVVNASTAKDVTASVSVTVGSEAFGGEAQSLSTTATNYTFNGSATGEIIVRVAKPSSANGALYVKSIVVTYSSSDPLDPSVATTVTIDDSGITNTNVFTSTAAGQLSATVKAGENPIEGATVTWSSSEEEVATIDEDGIVTLVAAGTTTITASYAGIVNEYKSSSKTYVLTVINSDPNAPGTLNNPFTVAQAIDFITAKEYDTNTNYYVKGIISSITSTSVLSGGYLTYYISDDGTTTNDLQVYKGKNLDNTDFTDVSDIEVGDNVTIVGPLFYYNNKTPEFNVGNYIYTTDHKNREDAGLTVVADFEMEVTTTKPVKEVYVKDSDGEVTITSDNEAVVKVENGLLKALSVGSAVITVSVAKTGTYKAASDHFTVTVGAREGVEPEGQGAGSTSSYFVKVTSTDDITNGNYLIVYEGETYNDAFDGSLPTLDAANNGFSVTINDNTIAATEKLLSAVFTIDKTNGTLKSASGNYIGVSSNSNGLKQTDNAETYRNSFAIDENGNAVISAVFENSTMTLRYNYASNQNRFRYYSSGQQPIKLYKYVETTGSSTFDIAVSTAGWRGLVTAVDATLPETLTAYTVTAYNESTATLTKVDAVKADTPYIVKGNEGTYTLTVAEEDVEAPKNNLLQISTQNTGNGVYVLYNGASGVGFYLWSGGSLGAGRVYLPAIVNAREFIGLDSETTGISTVNSEAKSLFNGEFFNMAGQRVAKPAKGLYIVNGKKVVIK